MKPITIFSIIAVGLLWPMVGQPAGMKSYKNENYGFCINYPRDWQGQEPFDKNGILLIPRSPDGYVVRPEITVSARINQPSETDENKPQTLQEIADFELASIRDYEHPRSLRLLSQSDTHICSSAAHVMTVEFTESKSGEAHVFREMFFISPKDIVYKVGLECHLKDSDRASQIWEEIVQSLKLCGEIK